MKKKILITVFCSLAILSTGCVKEQKLQDGKEVVAEIEGKNFTAEDFYKLLKDTNGPAILIEMIDNYIASVEIEDDTNASVQANEYIQELKKQYTANGTSWELVLASNGFSSEEELIETYKNYYLKEEVAKKWFKDSITEDEINDYYKNEIIGDITAKHILIEPEVTSDMKDEEKKKAEEDALAKAKEIITKLNNGSSFDELAKEYSSDDSNKNNGGLLPAFNKQSSLDNNFIAEAVKLDTGKYSKEPVKSQYVYHIIYVVSKAEKPTLDTVLDLVKDEISKNKIQKDEKYYYTAWIKLREKYNLVINDTLLKEGYETLISQYK